MHDKAFEDDIVHMNAGRFNYPGSFGYLITVCEGWIQETTTDRELADVIVAFSRCHGYAGLDGRDAEKKAVEEGRLAAVKAWHSRDIRAAISQTTTVAGLYETAYGLMEQLTYDAAHERIPVWELTAHAGLVRVLARKRLKRLESHSAAEAGPGGAGEPSS